MLYRARQIADGGTRALFADLDPAVRWRDGVLSVKCGADHSATLDLDERGLLLLPSVFVWPKVTIVTAPPWQPTLIYPARGIGMLWNPERTTSPDALAKLIGANRAAVLMALDRPLDRPRSTPIWPASWASQAVASPSTWRPHAPPGSSAGGACSGSCSICARVTAMRSCGPPPPPDCALPPD